MDIGLFLEALVLALALFGLLLFLTWVVETTAPPETVGRQVSGSARQS
jgi:hypothetical protein